MTFTVTAFTFKMLGIPLFFLMLFGVSIFVKSFFEHDDWFGVRLLFGAFLILLFLMWAATIFVRGLIL